MSKLITLDNLRTFKAKLDETISSSGGGTKTVDFDYRAYTPKGYIYAEDLAILLADRNNTITFGGEIYRLVDNQVKSDRLFYIHLGESGYIHGIYITISTKKWDKYDAIYDLNDYISKATILGDSSGVIYYDLDTDSFYRINKKKYKHTIHFVAFVESTEEPFFFTVESDQAESFTSANEIEDGCYTAYSSNIDNVIGTLQVFIDNSNGVYKYGGAVCIGNNSYTAVREELRIESDNVEPLFQI